MKLAVLVACFNRVKTTLANLGNLTQALESVDGLEYKIFLLDDASPDGTGEAVSAAFPGVEVVPGTGSLFWGQGTCAAYQAARRSGPFDAYLLFNDDVAVGPAEVRAFFDDYREANAISPSLLSGPTWSPDRSSVTYGGFRMTSRFRPLSRDRVTPNGTLLPIDLANGNFLLVPGPFFEQVGGLDPSYKMGYADIDLSLTAKQHGVALHMARSPIGVCATNPIMNRIAALDISGRWKLIQRSPLFWFSGYSHFMLKHAPILLYPAYVLAFLLRLARIIIAPQTLIPRGGQLTN